MIESNGLPLINGVAHGWCDVVTTIAGVPVTGITAVTYSDEQVVDNGYGSGRHPVNRYYGRIEPKASITLKMDEVVALQRRAVNGRLQSIAPFDITVTYMPSSGIIVHDVIRNCSFKNNARDLKAGTDDIEVPLTLVPSHIEWNSK